MRQWLLRLTFACLLASCAQPPPSAYVGGSSGASQGNKGIGLGQNASGESCNLLPSGASGSFDVFCGTWQQPAARISDAGPGDAASLMSVATSSPWRSGINDRFDCNAPTTTTVLQSDPAVMLQCTRRIGGWPQVALLVVAGGRLYQADGILPTLPLIERAVGVQSGQISAATVALPQSAADSLLASRLAAHAFRASDVGEYQRLMELGARSNLAENFAAAETAYRAALALQQHALGHDDPDTVNALMHLALQVSDQGRFAEADALFRQADTLAPRATDKAAAARLAHYRALNALNQNHDEQALSYLDQAARGYAALVPRESLQATNPGVNFVAANGATALVTPPDQQLMVDPTAQSALMGLIEVRRYQSIVLRRMGRPAESAAAIASAQSLAKGNGIGVPIVTARLTRTAATAQDLLGYTGAAEAGLATSRIDFTQVVPQTRPVAETALLQAGVAAKQGDTAAAVLLCQRGTELLRELRSGTDPTLLEPCLSTYATEAARNATDRQRLLGAMFETSELAQDSTTSREIDEAAARLAANTKDPKIAQAIRRRQDAGDHLAELFRQRDALAGGALPGSASPDAPRSPAALDKAIAEAQAELADADGALQAAAPNYGQLVQQVVPASEVLAALKPGEALAAITLTRDGGWTFLLRDGTIDVAPVKANGSSITALVKRVRASIESPNGELPPFDAKSAQGIYDATLRPLSEQLTGAKSLVVAPTGPLLSLPFALLLTGSADPANLAAAPWLVRQMAVAHVPSAANFVALRKAGTSRAAHPWFGFGGFHPVTLAQAEASFPGASCSDSAKLFASLPPLPYAQRELDAARALLGGSPSDELLNTAFTAEAVRKMSLTDYRILHFATHALLPAELRCQDQPAIVTSAPAKARNANGALLTASDVVGLNLDANVVILSACNSGGPGNSTSGESLSGLARAFFFAGARSMLVTHWSINDQTSAFLVADTLRRLAANEDGGLAGDLRAAQLGLIDRAGKDLPAQVAHPFFWAPFALIGEGVNQFGTTHTAMR
ncbi:MAG TPA: CHAT domain-containing protein [Acetobacteraceae bacterium]|nr:CHAT domain-containing protein [Acetobacteraceae bacterium]